MITWKEPFLISASGDIPPARKPVKVSSALCSVGKETFFSFNAAECRFRSTLEGPGTTASNGLFSVFPAVTTIVLKTISGSTPRNLAVSRAPSFSMGVS